MANPHYESVRAEMVKEFSHLTNEIIEFKHFIGLFRIKKIDFECFNDPKNNMTKMIVKKPFSDDVLSFYWNELFDDDLAQQDPSVWEALDKMLT